MDDVRIQTDDFDPGVEISALTEGGTEAGAVASFVGLVRGDDGLDAMTLEHYPAMTEGEIRTHVTEARRRWELLEVRIIHRVGRLKPGERIVFVGVASSHRQAAFEAAQFLMDYLKSRAPFWKFEDYGDRSQWVEARTEDQEALKRW